MILHIARVIFILLEVLILFNLLSWCMSWAFSRGAVAGSLHREIRRLVWQTALEEDN
jgi:hypothetical protein